LASLYCITINRSDFHKLSVHPTLCCLALADAKTFRTWRSSDVCRSLVFPMKDRHTLKTSYKVVNDHLPSFLPPFLSLYLCLYLSIYIHIYMYIYNITNCTNANASLDRAAIVHSLLVSPSIPSSVLPSVTKPTYFICPPTVNRQPSRRIPRFPGKIFILFSLSRKLLQTVLLADCGFMSYCVASHLSPTTHHSESNGRLQYWTGSAPR